MQVIVINAQANYGIPYFANTCNKPNRKGVKMHYKKSIITSCIIMLSVFMFTGCGNTKQESTKTQTSEETVVQVTKIDGDTITATVGEWESHQPDQNEQDEPPTMPSGEPDKKDNSNNSQGEPPAMPSGSPAAMPSGKPDDAPATMPSGQPNNDNKGGFGQFIAGEKTITFTVTDNTTIKIEQGPDTKEATLSDITENSVLTIVTDDQDQASSIIIKGNTPAEQQNQ